LWPLGFRGGFEWASAAIGLFAVAALFRFRVGVITLICACATLGLVRGALL
jgi:chromate transporter